MFECTDKAQRLLVGKFCVTTYLFTVDHHGRLFFSSVLACVQVQLQWPEILPFFVSLNFLLFFLFCQEAI
jgi:hypothetical protein